MGDADWNFAPEGGNERRLSTKAANTIFVWRTAHEQSSGRHPLAKEPKYILIAERQKLAAEAFMSQFGRLEEG
jgi:hypothetical protein